MSPTAFAEGAAGPAKRPVAAYSAVGTKEHFVDGHEPAHSPTSPTAAAKVYNSVLGTADFPDGSTTASTPKSAVVAYAALPGHDFADPAAKVQAQTRPAPAQPSKSYEGLHKTDFEPRPAAPKAPAAAVGKSTGAYISVDTAAAADPKIAALPVDTAVEKLPCWKGDCHRQEAKEVLSSKPPGTFLLRTSNEDPSVRSRLHD